MIKILLKNLKKSEYYENFIFNKNNKYKLI